MTTPGSAKPTDEVVGFLAQVDKLVLAVVTRKRALPIFQPMEESLDPG